MKIALITEGTYPFVVGGVSVWCDQLIRGLSNFEFEVIALTGNGLETNVYPVPPNLKGVVNFPLWNTVRRGRSKNRSSRWFDQVHHSFVTALTQPNWGTTYFLWALRAMAGYAQQADLGAALLSEASLGRLIKAWKSHQPHDPASGPLPNLTLQDALLASQLLEHLLRPLRMIPPKANVYHAVSNGPAAIVAMMGKWHDATPFVLTEHGVYLRERYLSYLQAPYSPAVQTLILNFFRLLSSTAYRMADLIVPVSDYNRRWEERNGAFPSSIRPIHNGIDPGQFPPPAGEPEVPTLTFVGRIDPLKDLHTLIESFAYTKKHVPNARLRMFGPTPTGNERYRESCERLIEELGLQGAATFEGRISPAALGYQAGHVAVLSSISESFPYAVIEAMSCERATVSTDVGGVSEAVGDAGILVPARDPQAMGEACTELLVDSHRRIEMGKAARARVLKYFTLERFLNDYRKMYHDVVFSSNSRKTPTEPKTPTESDLLVASGS
ncbi:GT4 family glycosyltransferase PelF [uncultured Meiothermus sp.]|jgi:glycosyltransferase involved in cell wall biosynthesis|uniref:GT4 family glycosyltransferase PelF n=1 Tax=uncultured Meiothermus sp. TaxID=157471 RepID=UPI0026253D90|nr:GT4 family glycosyltransferase PelF [uncultured Meiothermus sp.]